MLCSPLMVDTVQLQSTSEIRSVQYKSAFLGDEQSVFVTVPFWSAKCSAPSTDISKGCNKCSQSRGVPPGAYGSHAVPIGRVDQLCPLPVLVRCSSQQSSSLLAAGWNRRQSLLGSSSISAEHPVLLWIPVPLTCGACQKKATTNHWSFVDSQIQPSWWWASSESLEDTGFVLIPEIQIVLLVKWLNMFKCFFSWFWQ